MKVPRSMKVDRQATRYVFQICSIIFIGECTEVRNRASEGVDLCEELLARLGSWKRIAPTFMLPR